MTESLPSGMPPGISRRLTMTLMELVYESAIQYIASRNPASRLRTKTFPVSQILVKPTPTPHIKKSSYGVGRQPLDESGRRRGRGLGLEGGANDGLDSRYLKYWIHYFKQFESNCHRVKHLSHDVRSNEFRSKFTCGQLERDVLGRQPNHLTTNIKWVLRTVTVRRRLVPLASPDKGLSGEPPCLEASLNEHLRG